MLEEAPYPTLPPQRAFLAYGGITGLGQLLFCSVQIGLFDRTKSQNKSSKAEKKRKSRKKLMINFNFLRFFFKL
ncbi:MAG: hypothetical protein LBK96_07240 [Prevotellaceae bacterium]|jgi:hypothetical protein|nr:hypothetical protein [Prevotellaceae bacterium]